MSLHECWINGNIAIDAGKENTPIPFARGKTSFGSDEIKTIAGKTSDELRLLYPSRKRFEVIHRNDLVLL